MFIFLDRKKEAPSKQLKRRTTIDFHDWATFVLALLGSVLIILIWYKYSIAIESAVSSLVLWFTAIVLIQYTKETYWLKQVNQKQLKYQMRPVLKIGLKKLPGQRPNRTLVLTNIGKGATLNIEMRLSLINKNGDFSVLQNLVTDDNCRILYNLGENESVELDSSHFFPLINKYIDRTDPLLSAAYAFEKAFAIIATYEDTSENPYYTIAIIHVNDEGKLMLKTTKTHSYDSGELEKISPIDIIK